MSVIDRIRDYNMRASGRAPNRLPKILPRKPLAERNIVGMGAPPDMARIKAAAAPGDGLGDIISAIKDSANCPVWNMDIIEQVRWTLAGPQTADSVAANFGPEIDLFGSGKAPQGISFVETTMAQPGQTQTYMITCYIGFHLEPEPLCWTAQGNAWTNPASPVTTTPISPDAWTDNDITGTPNPLGVGAGQDYIQAVLEWGWWANYAAWHLARGYNLRWKIGQQTNIMDEVLRHTAYMPPSAQEGSASSSQVDIINFVNRVNQFYTASDIGSPLIFLKQNAVRIGSTTVGGANTGVFVPSRAGELVGATYGGMDLRSMLRGNSEFRKLTLPYLIKPGIPIGLILQVNDPIQQALMQQYLSVTQQPAGVSGTVPPVITDAPNVAAGGFSGTGVTPTGLEVELNESVPATNRFQKYSNDRALFKGGELKMSMLIKGFEVTEDWYMAMAQDPTIRQIVMSGCGIALAQQGA